MREHWSLRSGHEDRISGLPDEVLNRILCLIPTKKAAATRVLSKRFNRAFVLRNNVDLDDSPISYCSQNPYLIECFHMFVTFVDSVLRALCRSSEQHLDRFRLRFGGAKRTHQFCKSYECDDSCFPHFHPTRLHAWLSFPLTRMVRELDLYIHVRKDSRCKLPPALFTCVTLLVLHLDSNLDVGLVTHIHLPLLKLLHLRSLLLSEDGFLNRLVSNCPSLEDLSVDSCWWKHSDSIKLSSPSLRRLGLNIWKCDDLKSSDLVFIDAPNLHYFSYCDNLARCYSITYMTSLVKASIAVENQLLNNNPEASFQSMLRLIRALSNAQNLSLIDISLVALGYGELNGQMPLFQNLKYLELGRSFGVRWDKVLLEILNSSPFLETLSFVEGLIDPSGPSLPDGYDPMELELHDQFWTTTQASPSCFQSHLRRIVIKGFCGLELELQLVKFLLSRATILEEFVIHLCTSFLAPNVTRMSLETEFRNLPRASMSCSIQDPDILCLDVHNTVTDNSR